MAFTEDEINLIKKHIEEFTPGACPICSNEYWDMHPEVGAICAQQETGVNLFKALQLVQLVCQKCGYVVSYDADKVGVSMEVDLNVKR